VSLSGNPLINRARRSSVRSFPRKILAFDRGGLRAGSESTPDVDQIGAFRARRGERACQCASGLLGADGLSSGLGKLDGYLNQASGAASTVHETSSSLQGAIPSSLSPAIAASLNQAAKTFAELGAAADNAAAKAGQVADNAGSWWTVLFVVLVIVAVAALANLGWRIWLHRRWRALRHTRAEAVVIGAIAALTPIPSAHTTQTVGGPPNF